jgi:hypothetical protein
VVSFSEHYDSTVQDVVQAAAAHRKSQNSIRLMFTRTTPADAQLALSKLLSNKPDVWIAEQNYYSAVHDMKIFWDERIKGKCINLTDQAVDEAALGDSVPEDASGNEKPAKEEAG